MSMFDQARDAAQNFAASNPDKVEEAIQRVGDEVDRRTGGRFTEQVDQAEQAVADQMGVDRPEEGNPEA